MDVASSAPRDLTQLLLHIFSWSIDAITVDGDDIALPVEHNAVLLTISSTPTDQLVNRFRHLARAATKRGCDLSIDSRLPRLRRKLSVDLKAGLSVAADLKNTGGFD